jgi:hypothetical protein
MEEVMSRTLLVAIAGLAFISTVAEARDGCGRGMYYNGRRCVPEVVYDRLGARVYAPGYERRYYDRRDYEPGVRIDVGPGVGVRVR